MKKAIKTEIGERINELIIHLNLTKYSFSKQIGVSHATIHNLFRNNNYPSSNMILKIAKAFNASPNWILTGEGDMFKEKKNDIPVKNNNDELSIDKNISVEAESLLENINGHEKLNYSIKDFYSIILSIKKINDSSSVDKNLDQLMIMVSDLTDQYHNLSKKHFNMLEDLKELYKKL